MRYWLFKSEPTTFSIDDLMKRPNQTEHWDGVRNYQVRNLLRDKIKVGDKGFFYHSSCTPPGIVGTVSVVKPGYPDFTAWDRKSSHYDPKSTKEKPIWYMVDVKFVQKFPRIITLDDLKAHPQLKNMTVLRRGNRLSVTEVTEDEWDVIVGMASV
jgi:predicted RNA-binding protein with PUA-like domain